MNHDTSRVAAEIRKKCHGVRGLRRGSPRASRHFRPPSQRIRQQDCRQEIPSSTRRISRPCLPPDGWYLAAHVLAPPVPLRPQQAALDAAFRAGRRSQTGYDRSHYEIKVQPAADRAAWWPAASKRPDPTPSRKPTSAATLPQELTGCRFGAQIGDSVTRLLLGRSSAIRRWWYHVLRLARAITTPTDDRRRHLGIDQASGRRSWTRRSR